MIPLETNGDLIPLDEFLQGIKSDCFTDYDGYGYYATKLEMDEKRIVIPSHLCNPNKYFEYPPPWATHVIWFNR